MREIKFRAVHLEHITEKFIGFSYWGRIDHKQQPSMDCFTSPSQLNQTYIKVDQEFTGLKDKNGKEIYEGDLVQLHEYGEVYKEVVFYKGSFCIHGFNFGVEKSEIIGNIHENPELLKQR